MTVISIEQRSGLAPSILPRNLAQNMAQVAENCRFDRGGVGPYRLPTNEETYPALSEINSLYKYQGAWLTSSHPRQYVGSVRPNDVYERIYFADNNYPKFRSGTAEYRLGLPRPPAPAVLIEEAGDTSNPISNRTSQYVIALVDEFGHEGPTSLPTAQVEVGVGGTVNINLGASTVTGNYALGAAARFRIYRTNVGSTRLYQFVADVAYGAASFIDDVPSSGLEEALLSENWVAAPDDDTALYPDGPLASLVQMPGNFLAGHTGNTLFFSEPSVPTAWPYYYPIDEKIVGVVVIQGGLLVLTGKKPRLFVGSHPSAMAEVPIESMESCVSARGIVDMGEYAIYPSQNGLVAASGNSARLITAGLLDSESWAPYQPSTIRAYQYQNKYLAFYGDSSAGTGFIFDPDGGRNSLVHFTGFYGWAGHFDATTDSLHLVYEDDAGVSRGVFNAGAVATYRWQSRPFLFPNPVAFVGLRVIADVYPVTITIEVDGVQLPPVEVGSSDIYRLPAAYRGREWTVTDTSQEFITGIYIADNLGELP